MSCSKNTNSQNYKLPAQVEIIGAVYLCIVQNLKRIIWCGINVSKKENVPGNSMHIININRTSLTYFYLCTATCFALFIITIMYTCVTDTQKIKSMISKTIKNLQVRSVERNNSFEAS